DEFAGGTAHWIDPVGPGVAQEPLAATAAGAGRSPAREARGVRFTAPGREVEITFDLPTRLELGRSQRNGGSVRLDALLLSAGPERGDSARRVITISARGEVDREPVNLTLDATRPGRAFDGLGGNFRLQNPRTDPQVIDFNLQNMRVAWARVEMP